jgi:hypothetical protein
LLVVGTLAGSIQARATDPQDASLSTPEGILTEAFRRRYDCTVTGIVEISARKGSTEAILRRIHVAAKFIDGRLHTYAVFREPEYIRGMAFLGIESDDPRSDDQRFVYLPSTRRIRRVGAVHTMDSFLGTDLNSQDFERRQAGEYRLDGLRVGEIGGEPVYELTAYPRFHSDYEAVQFSVAKSDFAILGTDYLKRGDESPFKRMQMPRDSIYDRGECLIPTVLRIENYQRKTTTELAVRHLLLNAELDDSLFSMTALDTGRSIPGLAGAKAPPTVR